MFLKKSFLKSNEIISSCFCWMETVVLLKHLVIFSCLVPMYIIGFLMNTMDLVYYYNTGDREM